jgi:F0F1-type ATP synthase alpha subunit
MVDVKPDEISAILKQQLIWISKAEAELEEVGTVLQVGDGIAQCIWSFTKAQAGELVEFETGVQAIVLNLEEDNVGVVLLGFRRRHQRRIYGKNVLPESPLSNVGEELCRSCGQSTWPADRW